MEHNPTTAWIMYANNSNQTIIFHLHELMYSFRRDSYEWQFQ